DVLRGSPPGRRVRARAARGRCRGSRRRRPRPGAAEPRRAAADARQHRGSARRGYDRGSHRAFGGVPRYAGAARRAAPARPRHPHGARVIRTTLSTRPFYNERAVHLGLLVAALVVAAATVFTVTAALRYRRGDSEQARQADANEARTVALRN